MAHIGPLPKVAIIGLGGVGGVLAASLHAAGRCALTLVARGVGLQTLRRSGLDVTTFEGNRYRTGRLHFDIYDEEGGSVRVVSSEDLSNGQLHAGGDESPQDYVLLTTKSYQLTSTLDALRKLTGPHTTIVPCTNGLPWWFHPNLCSVDPDGRLGREINSKQILGTVGTVSGNVVGTYQRWESRWPSKQNVLTVGEPFSSKPSRRAQKLASLFDDERVRVTVDVVPDIRSRMYDKILINCSLNPIGAICNIDCGQTAEPDSIPSRMLRSLVNEAAAVASKVRPPLHLTMDADKILNIYRDQYGLQTSMLRDVLAGRRTEVDSIVRSVVELGEVYGVETPRLKFVADVVETMDLVGRTDSGKSCGSYG